MRVLFGELSFWVWFFGAEVGLVDVEKEEENWEVEL